MENYYRILSQAIGDNSAEFTIELCDDCPVYAGHFPGNPIAPGACNIEMVRECASIALNRDVRIAEIKLCKFLRIIRPSSNETLSLSLKFESNKLKTTVSVGEELAIQLNMIIN